jgi:hypothetical protein
VPDQTFPDDSSITLVFPSENEAHKVAGSLNSFTPFRDKLPQNYTATVQALDEAAGFVIKVPKALIAAWLQMMLEKQLPENTRVSLALNPPRKGNKAMVEIGLSFASESVEALGESLKAVLKMLGTVLQAAQLNQDEAQKVYDLLNRAAETGSNTKQSVETLLGAINNELVGVLRLSVQGFTIPEPEPLVQGPIEIITPGVSPRLGQRIIDRIAPQKEEVHTPTTRNLLPLAAGLGAGALVFHIIDR